MLKQGLNAVVMPLVLSLSEKVDGNGGVGVGIVEPKAVMNNVEKLKNCLRSLEIDSQSLGSVFGQIYHMLNKVIQQSINNCALCERVVSCYKAAIRNMRSDFSPFFPSLAQDLVLSFQKSRLPPFLYCASILVQEFKPINPEEAVISGSHGEVMAHCYGKTYDTGGSVGHVREETYCIHRLSSAAVAVGGEVSFLSSSADGNMRVWKGSLKALMDGAAGAVGVGVTTKLGASGELDTSEEGTGGVLPPLLSAGNANHVEAVFRKDKGFQGDAG